MKRLLCNAAIATFVVGCSGGGSNLDGGTGGGDMAMKAAPPAPPVYMEEKGMKTNLKMEDFKCAAETPGPMMETEIEGKIQDFQDDNLVRRAKIKLYKNADDALAGKPVAMAESDKDGKYKIKIPAGMPARVVWSNEGGKAVKDGNEVDTIPTYEFNYKWDDKERIAVKVSTREAIPGLVSVIPDEKLAVLAGGVRTCSGKDVGGARVKLTDVGKTPEGKDYDADGLTFYFVEVSGSTLPTRTQKWTSGNGAFAALNVPAPGKGKVTVYGVIGDPASAPLKIAEGSVPVLPGAITILEMFPFENGPQPQ